MEGANKEKIEINIRDEGSGKRKWGSGIYNFWASGDSYWS